MCRVPPATESVPSLMTFAGATQHAVKVMSSVPLAASVPVGSTCSVVGAWMRSPAGPAALLIVNEPATSMFWDSALSRPLLPLMTPVEPAASVIGVSMLPPSQLNCPVTVMAPLVMLVPHSVGS